MSKTERDNSSGFRGILVAPLEKEFLDAVTQFADLRRGIRTRLLPDHLGDGVSRGPGADPESGHGDYCADRGDLAAIELPAREPRVLLAALDLAQPNHAHDD